MDLDHDSCQRALTLLTDLALEADRFGIPRERTLMAVISAMLDIDPVLLAEAVRDGRGRLEPEMLEPPSTGSRRGR